MIKEIIEYINNPKSSKSCFDLAEWYYEQKQFASALIYYLKVTEINDNDELTYFSLLKGGRGLHIQGYQTYQAKGMYLQAISVLPNRSEGWYWLSKIQTELGEWMEGYASSVTGYSKEDSQTSIDVEYSGKQSFLITQAECLIKFDRKREAIEIFISLLEKSKLTGEQRSWCELNMNTLWGNGWVKPSYYVKDKPLIFSFEDKNLIQKNYSQIFQDIFVLMVLNGKKNGTYLEIGAYEPEEHSNTKLLEKLGWKGLSLEIDVNLVNKFNGLRTNKCLWQDATTANYKELLQIFNFNKTIDYLQLDCEPAQNTFSALLNIPFEEYQFRIITYEHDYYCDETKSYRDKSRRYLQMMGYELVVSNVSSNDSTPFEDWWVHPDLVDRKIIDILKNSDDTIKNAEKYIYNEL